MVPEGACSAKELTENDQLRQIYAIYYGNRKAAVLAVAQRYRVFDFLEAREPAGATLDDIVQAHGFSVRGTKALLLALEYLNLVKIANDRYFLAPSSRQFLVSTAPESVAGLIDLEFSEFITPSALDQALRSGRPQVYDAVPDVWQQHQQDTERCVRFTAAMHAISSGPARAMVQRLALEPHWGLHASLATRPHRLLDVGGGSGCYAIEWMRHAPVPNSEADVLETPACSRVTQHYIDEAASSIQPNRIRVLSGDMFTEEAYGDANRYTHVLLSQILHDWPVRGEASSAPRRDGERLVELAWRALSPGGVLVVHEKLVHDEDSAMVSIDMLHWTEGQQYTEAMMRELLRDAHFIEVRFRKTPHTYWWLALAQRPFTPST
jgi:hypothetical protein